MTPRTGGEADKFGNRYEGAWTVRQLFEVLLGNADAITVEPTGDAGSGVEFILERPGALDQVHQVKRQRGSANSWTLRALETEWVLAAAAHHVEAGREFHFVSTVPSRLLDRLADRARRSNSLEHFIDGFLDGKEITDDFNYLASTVWGTPRRAREILRGFRVRWPDERELRATNSALAGMILAGGEPALAWLGLGDLILNDLGVRLSPRRAQRAPRGLRPSDRPARRARRPQQPGRRPHRRDASRDCHRQRRRRQVRRPAPGGRATECRLGDPF